MEHIQGHRFLQFVKKVVAVKKERSQKEKTKQFLLPHIEAVREHVDNDTMRLHLQQLEQKISSLIEQEQLACNRQQEQAALLFRLQEKIRQTQLQEKIKPFQDFEKISVAVDTTAQEVAVVKETMTTLEAEEKQKELAIERVKELEEKIAEKTRKKREDVQEIEEQLSLLEEQLHQAEKNAPKQQVRRIKSLIDLYKRKLMKIKNTHA